LGVNKELPRNLSRKTPRDRARMLIGWLVVFSAFGWIWNLEWSAAPGPPICENPALDGRILRCHPAGKSSGKDLGDRLGAENWLVGRRMDVNQATRRDLMMLPRVGYDMAEKILTARDERGPFCTLGELRAIKGIGPKTLERMKPLIYARCKNPEWGGPL
jgi:competence ComEA-like helix-hairpin-helix protein